VIRGGAAVTAEGSFQVPPAGTESGDGNKGSSVSTATFNLSKYCLRREGRRRDGLNLGPPLPCTCSPHTVRLLVRPPHD
jgi:hypothetical protein